jgi:hypothetical protein
MDGVLVRQPPSSGSEAPGCHGGGAGVAGAAGGAHGARPKHRATARPRVVRDHATPALGGRGTALGEARDTRLEWEEQRMVARLVAKI